MCMYNKYTSKRVNEEQISFLYIILVYLLNYFLIMFFFLLTNKPRPEIRIITIKKKKIICTTLKTKKKYIHICLTSNLQVYRNLILRVVSKNKYYKYNIIIFVFSKRLFVLMVICFVLKTITKRGKICLRIIIITFCYHRPTVIRFNCFWKLYYLRV